MHYLHEKPRRPMNSKLGAPHTMATPTVIAVLMVFVFFVIWAICHSGRLPQPFFSRSCQGKSWRRTFPVSSKQDIRDFLTLFMEAFACSSKERLKLNPHDRILQVYRARYPTDGWPDRLELEILTRDMASRYGLKLEDVWNENLTLGELFAHVQQRPPTATTPILPADLLRPAAPTR